MLNSITPSPPPKRRKLFLKVPSKQLKTVKFKTANVKRRNEVTRFYISINFLLVQSSSQSVWQPSFTHWDIQQLRTAPNNYTAQHFICVATRGHVAYITSLIQFFSVSLFVRLFVCLPPLRYFLNHICLGPTWTLCIEIFWYLQPEVGLNAIKKCNSYLTENTSSQEEINKQKVV
jgi:hypothetical protein